MAKSNEEDTMNNLEQPLGDLPITLGSTEEEEEEEEGATTESENESGIVDEEEHDDEESASNHRDLKNDDMEDEKQKLAKRENRLVAWLRIIVIIVLMLAAAFVSIGVYRYVRYDQINAFEDDFEAHAGKLIESFYETIERKLEAIDSLSVMYTSYARGTGATFPNVTLPDIEIRGAGTRILSETSVITYAPLVTDENRKGWEAYVIENRDKYFDEAYASGVAQRAYQDEKFGLNEDKPASRNRLLQEDDKEDEENTEQQQQEEAAPSAQLPPLNDVIGNLDLVAGKTLPAPEGVGPYMPVWQMTPVTPFKNILNFNLLSHPAGGDAFREMIRTGQAVLDAASNLNNENFGITGAFFQANLAHSQYRRTMQQYLGEPSTALAYPVFNSFDHANRKVVGMFSTSVFWVLYFKDVLPDNAPSIMCVLENSRNQTMTFRVKGREATYLGPQDMHDTKYDYLEIMADVNKYVAEKASIETRSYTYVDLNDNYTTYRLRVYPTQESEDIFVNSAPINFAIVILTVFLFTSLVFVSYDCLVARRQRIVMQRALASGAIVSSLFPSQVRDKLYQETATASSSKQQKRSNEFSASNSHTISSSVEALTASIRQRGDVRGSGGDSIVVVSRNAAPIADHFDDATILFADISGFTAWSSGRSPEQVFELLETIYAAFDKIAARRKVFKVETIGDCYLAVTGLPEPQPDHAIIMTKFAQDCLVKMSQLITEDLVDVLGVGTSDLGMRIGLHTGPVTAGVLRGQKSRFQLFGDTVNTASRIETSGEKGRIHCSQSTADALIKAGKQTWLVARKEKVQAKGKGEIQTYWIVGNQFKPSAAGSTTSRVEDSTTRSDDEVIAYYKPVKGNGDSK